MGQFVWGEQLAQWREQARTEAIAAGISPGEVDWLLQEVTDLDPLSLSLQSFKERGQIPSRHSLTVLSQLWQQRLQERLPVQYLVGKAHWRNFSLKVSPSVLIPRPETELLIDLALQGMENSPLPDLAAGHWADLGTGSGAIACGLAEVLPQATIHAVDRSAAALAIARENAADLGFAGRVHFYQGSWWLPLEALRGQIAGLVANPPYIPTYLLASLQPEVARHEPLLALDGGVEGLDAIRHLIDSSPTYLRSGGIWLVEVMAGQGEAAVKMLETNGNYEKIQLFPDLAGIPRFAFAYRCLNG